MILDDGLLADPVEHGDGGGSRGGRGSAEYLNGRAPMKLSLHRKTRDANSESLRRSLGTGGCRIKQNQSPTCRCLRRRVR